MSKTINNNLQIEYEEKGSKFLCFAFPFDNEKDISDKIKQIGEQHSKARHVLYVFRTSSGKEGACEDREPITSCHRALAILKTKNIEDVLVVMVRYFGGTLLGASHLDKLYFSLIFKLLDDSNLEEKKQYYFFEGKIKNIFLKKLEKAVLDEGGFILDKEFEGPYVKVKFKSLKAESEAYKLLI